MNISLKLITLALLLNWAPLQADHHAAPTQAVAMESAICQLNPGKSMDDFNDALETFKTWAKNNDYNTLMTVNTPLYIGGGTDIDILMLEFTNYENMGAGWDKIGQTGAEMLTAVDAAASCRRALAHYFPFHAADGIAEDDDRVLVVNWCTRHEGVSWDDLNAVHRSWEFDDMTGYAGMIIPALGIRDGDYPGEFGHLRVYKDAAALLAVQNQIANEGGWRPREDYFDNYADCAGSNAYLQSVVTSPN